MGLILGHSGPGGGGGGGGEAGEFGGGEVSPCPPIDRTLLVAIHSVTAAADEKEI